jgi:hypothetical protein
VLTSLPSTVHHPATGGTLCTFCHQRLGSYIVSVDDVPVFTVSDIDDYVSSLLANLSVPATVSFFLTPERRSTFDDCPSPLLCMHNLHGISALQAVSGEDMTPHGYRESLDTFTSDLSDVNMAFVIQLLQTEGMTAEEHLLTKFSQRNLQKLSNWANWDASCL